MSDVTPLSKLVLLLSTTADEFFAGVLDIARNAGLAVDTWRVGDPTRTLFRALASRLADLEDVAVEYAKSHFLSTAEGDWLALRAKDVYNVDKAQQTFAAPSVTFDNAGGGLYELVDGELIVRSSATGATYALQGLLTIDPLTSGIPGTFVAQIGGSAGTVTANQIDEIVSPTLTGVTIASSTAAVGADAQSDPGLREDCLATLGALSPDGPADAYEYVARSEALTGVAGIVRAKSFGDTTDGTVTVYIATAAAGVSGGVVTAVQAAVDTWAQPLCTLATVASGTPEAIDVTSTRTPYRAEDDVVIEAKIAEYLSGVKFGGIVARSALIAAHHAAVPDLVTVTLTVPAADADLADNEFPIAGSYSLS